MLTLGMSCFAFADDAENTAQTEQQPTEQPQEVAQADASSDCCEQNNRSESNE